ncbi:MAG: 1-deoxy-D-xylulose-5-phosphate synthase [Bacilli bacterium]|nr:1-deoxy-D-xylulose-5-phosphate synthase [Bacilli bacterium]
MQLEKIKKINDIKKLSISEKKELSSEIREYLLEVVSKNGGHLASNLGVVELTIALESVFDVKKDKIIWDVGHQCYVHKILTGRKEDFKTLRQFGGLSGFPKVSESFVDTFNTGHSSTSISAAMGYAMARDLEKKNYHVIAVIGDGALTGGMALEALNHAGSTDTNLIVILNDNEMSISKNIGGMNKLLTNLRIRKNYTKSNKVGKNIVRHIPLVGNYLVHAVVRMKNSIKQMILPAMYFEEIGFRYLGPVDGHNISDLEDLLSKAKDLEGPTLIHVLTKKGKGYKFAEENPDQFHGVSQFDLETGKAVKFKSMDYSKAFGDYLVTLAQKNKKIVAVTAAMKDGVGLTRFSEKYPNRFFDVGIAEQHALTFAAGLASAGMIPFVSIYSSFYQRAYDQIIHDICLQKLHVIMCVDRAGIVGNDGATHQGMFDLSFFRLIPNITIMAPRDFEELRLMMDFAVHYQGPIVIRYPRGGENIIDSKCPSVRLGHANVIQEGKDLSIITIGNSVYKGICVSEKLRENDISCEIINARFLKPLDDKTIIKSISKTKKFIVIEDGTIMGGLCSAVKELMLQNHLCKVESLFYAYPDHFIEHGSVSKLEKKYKMDVDSIYKDIMKNFYAK